jgi:HK97 family phage major capsid protein
MDYPRLSTLTTTQLQQQQVVDLMRVLSAKTFDAANPVDYFVQHWPRSAHRDIVVKHFERADFDVPYTHAAVAAGNTTDATWAGPLMVPSLVAGFLPLVRASSIVGKVPFTPAPFNVRLTKQITGASTGWVGENVTKPVSKLGFGNVDLPWSKSLSIVVVTRELMRLAAPGSDQLLAQTLKDEIALFTDRELLGSGAAVAGVRPAGILAGVAPVTSTGDLAADLGSLVAAFFAARPSPLAPWFILSPPTASQVAALDIGRDVTVTGGTLLGLPVAVSAGAANNAIVVDAPAVYVADAGIDVDVSEYAVIQMDDAPASPPVAATVATSLWQNDLAGIKAERFVHWVVAAANAVQYLAVA